MQTNRSQKANYTGTEKILMWAALLFIDRSYKTLTKSR